jgi:hypothetical protein
MKIKTIFALFALLSTSGYALAGGGAPVPEGSTEAQGSGRPSEILPPAECDNVWKLAAPSGDVLSKDKATPFVVNYAMVDSNNDGSISVDEFKTGCSKGWIQKGDKAATENMKGSPAEPSKQ